MHLDFDWHCFTYCVVPHNFDFAIACTLICLQTAVFSCLVYLITLHVLNDDRVPAFQRNDFLSLPTRSRTIVKCCKSA